LDPLDRRRCCRPRRLPGRRAASAHGKGVRPALVPGRAPEPGLLPRSAHERRLGLLSRARYRHGHGARAAPPGEARGRPFEPRGDRDRLGHRLPASGVTTLGLILAFGLATIVASAVLVPRLPTLQLQLAALALLAVCLPLAVVLASGLVM